MLIPEFLYQFTRSKDAQTQGLEVVSRAVDTNGAGVISASSVVYTVPSDRVFVLASAVCRIQLLNGLGQVLNTVFQMLQPNQGQPRYFIAQDERIIAGLGIGNYRGIASFSGQAWFTPGQQLMGIGSWSSLDDYVMNVSILGISIPRASAVLG